jgi:hypothetical protein
MPMPWLAPVTATIRLSFVVMHASIGRAPQALTLPSMVIVAPVM